MSVENEIVRFIAEVDLDPQDAAAFTANLKKANEDCETLRQTIAKTHSEMAVLRARGEESSEEYKDLSKTLAKAKNQLKEQTAAANKYAAALDKEKMSIKQLKEHAKQLRTALNAMHKDANPELWEKYNKELIETEKRLDDLKVGVKGIKEPLLSFNKMKEVMKSPATWMAAGAKAAHLLWQGFKKMTEQSQVWGDKWGITVAQLQAGWNQLIANIAQGDEVMKGSVREAMAAAKQAQLLRDELFERQNSYSIVEAEYQGLINQQQAIAQDSSRTSEERMAALNEILRLEEELAATKKSIAQQEQEAALLELSTRTKLGKEELKLIIDEYEVNRNIIKQAEDYLALEEKIVGAERSLSYLKMADGEDGYDMTGEIANAEARIALLREEKNTYSGVIQTYADYIKQYNLGNDEMVKAYVAATVNILNADNDLSASLASQARRRGSLITQMEKEQKQAREKAYKDRIDAADKAYKKEILLLKEQLLAGEITEAEFSAKSLSAETAMLGEKLAINKAFGKDIVDIETALVDLRLSIQQSMHKKLLADDKAFREAMKKQDEDFQREIDREAAESFNEMMAELDDDPDLVPLVVKLFDKYNNEKKSVTGRKEQLTADYDKEMADLQSAYDLKIMAEEEFLARKKELNAQYYSDIMKLNMESVMNAVAIGDQFISELSNMTSSIKEAELASLDAQMEKELAMAGDNAEEREAIEARYEAKKLDIQKKYADVDMGIRIAQALAAGAMAVMQCLAQLGPIAGVTMSAIVAATTAAQVAVIVAQRNAIKNAAPGSSGGSSSGGGQNVVGFSEGGSTGHGGRREVAGVVQRGEYVVPQPELRDPAVAAMVAGIESKRRRRTSAHALPGFAEGGYTGQPGDTPAESPVLSEILALLYSIADTPIPAYLSLSEFDAAQDIRSRFKSRTSLKRA